MSKPWLTKDIITKWENLVYSEECNCEGCLRKRSEEYWYLLLSYAYPELGFVPRIRDLNLDYHGHDQDARYEPTERALKLTIMNMKRLRTQNKKMEDYLKKENETLGVPAPVLSYCLDCGSIGIKENGLTHKHDWYCSGCSTRYEICTDCGKLMDTYSDKIIHLRFKKIRDKGERFRKSENRNVCGTCSQEYSQCHHCNCAFGKNTLTKIPYQRRGDLVHTYDACEDCLIHIGVKCEECGALTVTSIASRQEDGSYQCAACNEDSHGVMSHTFQPLVQRFHKGKVEGSVSSSGLFFGFELEVDSWKAKLRGNSGELMAMNVKDRVGCKRIYVVHDGTITRDIERYGIEIVSHPFTWNRYKKEDKLIWDDMLLFCRKKGWKSSTPNCGIHIHTTKAAWGTLQIYKLLQFIYHKKNYKFITFIAQRKPNRFCAMSVSDYDSAAYIAKNKKNRDREHYNIVNLNNKRGGEGKTIEFRMFKGTFEPLFFHKNIEFVHALYYFTRDYPNSKMFYTYFIEYIKNNINIYPHLNEFLKLGGKLCVL